MPTHSGDCFKLVPLFDDEFAKLARAFVPGKHYLSGLILEDYAIIILGLIINIHF